MKPRRGAGTARGFRRPSDVSRGCAWPSAGAAPLATIPRRSAAENRCYSLLGPLDAGEVVLDRRLVGRREVGHHLGQLLRAALTTRVAAPLLGELAEPLLVDAHCLRE